VLQLGGEGRHSEADRDGDLVAIADEAVPLDHAADELREPLGGLERAFRQDDRELLAPRPREQLVAADARRHEGRELLEHTVAREVSVAVVDRLEVVDVEHDQRERALVAPRAAELALEELAERALVVNPRETILDGHLVDGLVVGRLDVVAREELEDRVADPQQVAVRQPLGRDGQVVDERAVRALQVDDDEGAVVRALDPGVEARDGVRFHDDVGLGRAADEEGRAAQSEAPSELLPVDLDQALLAAEARAGPEREGAGDERLPVGGGAHDDPRRAHASRRAAGAARPRGPEPRVLRDRARRRRSLPPVARSSPSRPRSRQHPLTTRAAPARRPSRRPPRRRRPAGPPPSRCGPRGARR